MKVRSNSWLKKEGIKNQKTIKISRLLWKGIGGGSPVLSI